MREYNYLSHYKKILTPEIVSKLTQINSFKSRQNMFLEQKAEIFSGLLETALIQSTESSNNIEGIRTSSERLKLLAKDKTHPNTRDEQEIAGYRFVLKLIHENHKHIEGTSSYLLQLHGYLYKYSGATYGGTFKNVNNVITEQMPSGESRIRFRPVEAWETPDAIERLFKEYNSVVLNDQVDDLVATAMFILDFLCIHPFNDGNGRLSRLLTLLLLYRRGYVVGKYISIERIIEQTKANYYQTLEESSRNWHECENDYEPFVDYMLGVIIGAYREFEEEISMRTKKGANKETIIAEVIKREFGTISKRAIIEKCPDISDTTTQRALASLLKQKKIEKVGGGRYTAYKWIGER